MKTFRDMASLRGELDRWRKHGETVALVPTMGNLHAGHFELMRRAACEADRVVASIFVNPTQFGPAEDYANYPRTFGSDRRGLAAAGGHALFVPTVAAMYPGGTADATQVYVPGLSGDLCGRFRPAHFAGVTSVVSRLFNIVAPDVAVFGEKDYQQLVILRRMVKDLHFRIRIVGAPTVREADGLALSSRNQYLTADERAVAPALHAALLACRTALLAGERRPAALAATGLRTLRRTGFRPDYFEIREAWDLGIPGPATRELRILAAAWLGRARLLDNLPVRLPGTPRKQAGRARKPGATRPARRR